MMLFQSENFFFMLNTWLRLFSDNNTYTNIGLETVWHQMKDNDNLSLYKSSSCSEMLVSSRYQRHWWTLTDARLRQCTFSALLLSCSPAVALFPESPCESHRHCFIWRHTGPCRSWRMCSVPVQLRSLGGCWACFWGQFRWNSLPPFPHWVTPLPGLTSSQQLRFKINTHHRILSSSCWRFLEFADKKSQILWRTIGRVCVKRLLGI